jgi:hypothetical protein
LLLCDRVSINRIRMANHLSVFAKAPGTLPRAPYQHQPRAAP